MMKVAVLFGSRAAEHDVSIVSGLQLLENIDRSKYDAYPVYISRSGEWFVGEPLKDILNYKNFKPDMPGITKVYLPPVPGHNGLYAMQSGSGLFAKTEMKKIVQMDCAILSFHGMHGEDGTIQGLFELCDIPYSSVGVTGSGVGMDKIIMKAVFESMGLQVVPSKYCYRADWKKKPDAVLDEMEALGYPLIVKPANLGSSIGIGRADDRLELRNRMDVAAYYDRRILVERAIVNPIEINCACLGYGSDYIASMCEQPATYVNGKLLDFDKKYLQKATKGQGMASLARLIPAPIGEEMTNKIQRMTIDVFEMLECKGVVRIDYMIDPETNEVYINEINTIPGSFAFYLFEPMGMKYSALIDRLIACALQAQQDKEASEYAYDSKLIAKIIEDGGIRSGKAGSKLNGYHK
ncbi:D-alanine--D-alanine ligase [Christensenellaceae bacterium OttesenSCG-928-L17]|nr:D-alanine--D-alanine ligase [Christensenellaceae bacterium OttesenSCG-928-L17]